MTELIFVVFIAAGLVIAAVSLVAGTILAECEPTQKNLNAGTTLERASFGGIALAAVGLLMIIISAFLNANS